MKRIFTIIAFAAVAAVASAQTLSDAFSFSQNQYYGTARSLAMGNAMTAVGGDLGSVTINPAGSAVAGYSQITFTPNISVSVGGASFAAVAGTDPYSNEYKDHYTRFTVPNFGMTFNYKTGKNHGLKAVTFGIVANGTRNYVSTLTGSGRNDQTTFMGALATDATNNGFASSVLNNFDSYNNSQAPWQTIMGYRSGMIATYGGSDYDYIGSSETIFSDGSIGLAGPIDQTYGRRTYGSKYDVVLNLGFNVNDNFYFGFNLGIPTFSYQYDDFVKEFAVNPEDFPIEFNDADGGVTTTFFDNMRQRYSYYAQGTGVYGKFGILAKPAPGLRLGAAIQTPTAMHIDEKWQYAGETWFSDSQYDASDVSPEGSYSYYFTSPYRANVGVAYSFEGMGLVSVDYELCDYSTMKFRDKDGFNDTFDAVNADIKDFAGIQHNVRVGAEIKPVPQFALRAGYNLMTSPEYYFKGNTKKNVKALTHSVSLGAGYSSNGSFFFDVAARYTKLADEYVSIYGDYIDNVMSPEILNKAGLWDISATIGFRF